MKSTFRNSFNFLVCFLLALAAGGCSSFIFDDFDDDDLPPSDNLDTIGYMAVRLMPADGPDSRAAVGDSFDAGSTSELLLSTEAGNYAVFYTDGQDTPLAISHLNGMTGNQGTDSQANSSMVYATIVGRNELKEELQKMKECYVILNTDIPEHELLSMSKDDLMKIRVHSPFFYDSKGVKYFTMCNSVYVENGIKKIDTAVDTDKIYQSYQETIEQAWKGNAAVTAYVERLAAKISLGFENPDFNHPGAIRDFIPEQNEIILFSGLSEGDVPFYENTDPATGTPLSYRVRITGWGVNGLEQESFLFRNINPAANYFQNWFNASYKRAFWSLDCNYDNAVYPWQYRRVIDNSGIPVYEGADNILENFSFEEISAQGFAASNYAPENTFDFSDKNFSANLNDRPELLAGTHVIVCAELLSNIKNPSVWEPHEIYRDRNGSFYRNELDCIKALVASMNNLLVSHASLKFTYWDWSKGGVEYKLFGYTKGSYALYYKGKKLDSKYVEELYNSGVSLTSEAEFKGSDGKRILWADGMTIQDENGNLLQSYSNIDEVNSNNNVWLRESSVNDLKSIIFEHVGAVDHFKDGKMYYAIPVGYVKNNQTSADGSQPEYSVYGVVRNSSYNIVITEVTGLGTSVDVLSQPIIPNTVTSKDHLYIGFKILDWHPIDQTVPGVIN